MSDVSPASSDGGKFLDKKISGIKAQYLIVFGLAVAIGAYYYRKYKMRNNPAPVVVTPVVDTSGQAGGASFGSSNGGGGGGAGAATAPPAQTNGQWASAALNAAIANGSVNATDGANAVSAYLNGQALTPSQTNIIAKLVTAYGQPPEGVLPINNGPVPGNASPVRYIRDSRGQISAETATGNTYVLTLPEWQALEAQGATYVQLTDQDYYLNTHNFQPPPSLTSSAR